MTPLEKSYIVLNIKRIVTKRNKGERKVANVNGKHKILGISLKNDWDAVLLGAVAMFALTVVPVVSTPVIAVITKVRKMIGGENA